MWCRRLIRTLYRAALLVLLSSPVLMAQTSSKAASAKSGLESLRLISVAVSVADLDKAAAWYQDKLGFRLVKRTDNRTSGFTMAQLEKNGLQLELIHQPGSRNAEGAPQDPPRHLQVRGLRNLVLGVDDLAAANAELKAKGVPLIWEGKYIPEVGVSITNFRDPDGNLVAIWGKP